MPEQNFSKSSVNKAVKKCMNNIFSVETVKKRLPVIVWLPKYKTEYIAQDIIAGITVGLTAIPQGIAYAVIAGLPPEYGMYASLTSGIVYMLFGSCYNVTVGPTAILASMSAKYVAEYSPDFAILAAFLSGAFMLLLGIFNLGFLVEFISIPVITGFTASAALQIASAQLKSLFGTKGSAGKYFYESVSIFFNNITTVKLWEPVLGFGTVILLVLLKRLGQGCKRTDGIIKQARWFISLSRNAVVVVLGMIIAYVLKVTLNTEPLAVIGDIGSGLPKFTWPPFTTLVKNETYTFPDMVSVLGMHSIIIPFVAILESVSIAKAFAQDGRIDATQELIAVGLCNIVGSFGQSMTITGSFTRTALNHVSGVKTPAGGVTKVLLLIFALTYLTSVFYYIPKASLAGLILTAMYSMIDYPLIPRLWKSSWGDFFNFLLTLIVCLVYGLEYGILAGMLCDAAILLFKVARPRLDVDIDASERGDFIVVSLCENLTYCTSEHVRQKILNQSKPKRSVIIDGSKLKNIDYTGAVHLLAVVQTLARNNPIFLLNFNEELQIKILNVDAQFKSKDIFVSSASVQELIQSFPKDV